MSSATDQAETIPTPQSSAERLQLASELFQRFHATCFWHSPADLNTTEELVGFVAKGLRENGGRLGFILAGKLEPIAFDQDWSSDSPYRFFPTQKDDDFGYCLHLADIAVNKVLALAGRSEIRDFLDILQLDRMYLSLGAITWAACGKDEGYTRSLIVDLANRHAGYQESELRTENLVRQVDLKALKQQWISAREHALELFAQLPPEEIGCLYPDPTNTPVTPDPSSPDFSKLVRQTISPGGAWPADS